MEDLQTVADLLCNPSSTTLEPISISASNLYNLGTYTDKIFKAEDHQLRQYNKDVTGSAFTPLGSALADSYPTFPNNNRVRTSQCSTATHDSCSTANTYDAFNHGWNFDVKHERQTQNDNHGEVLFPQLSWFPSQRSEFVPHFLGLGNQDDAEDLTRREISEQFLFLVKNSDGSNDPFYGFDDSVEDDGHDETEKDKSIYECNVDGCNKQFAWLWALKDHEKKHSGDSKNREFPCDTCGKAFYTRSCLKSHMKIHTRKPLSYKCSSEGCSKRYSTSEGLRLHIRNHHQVDKKWLCPAEGCHKNFVRQSDLKLHMLRIHAKNRPHPCSAEGCEKSFACFSELKRHELSHVRKQRRQEKTQKARQKKR